MRSGALKRLAKALLPPVAIAAYKRCKTPPAPAFSGVFPSFDEAPTSREAWDNEFWLNTSKIKLERSLGFDDLANQDPWRASFPEKLHAANLRLARSFFPLTVTDYFILPCLIVNQLSRKGRCKVLDFAGGTGYAYHNIKSGLLHRERVDWHVVDSPRLALMGKDYQTRDDRIFFHDALNSDLAGSDVVFINTSVQYLRWPRMLDILAALRPRYFILTRLLSGEGPTTVSAQDIGGQKVPCTFINIHELVAFFEPYGYQLEFKSAGSPLNGEFAPDFPPERRIEFDAHCIFSRD